MYNYNYKKTLKKQKNLTCTTTITITIIIIIIIITGEEQGRGLRGKEEKGRSPEKYKQNKKREKGEKLQK